MFTIYALGTYGTANVYLFGQFPCEQWPKNNEMKVVGGWEFELVKARIGKDC